MDDIFADTVSLFSGEFTEDDQIRYGELLLTTAPKVRKEYLYIRCPSR